MSSASMTAAAPTPAQRYTAPATRVGRTTTRRPQLHLVYFALAAFDIITICSTLFLSQHIMSSYEQGVHVAQQWAARSAEIGVLGDLAQQTNAPGNDIFDSGDVAHERDRRDIALTRFMDQWHKINRELEANVSETERTPIQRALTDTRFAMEAMVGEADQIFAHIEAGRDFQAGRRMATMDRSYARLTTSISRAVRELQDTRVRHLQRQVATAEGLRRLESGIVGLVFIIVIAVAIYGHKISQVMRRNEEELEAAYTAVQHYADNVAHELRNPVNKMLIGTEVALSRDRPIADYYDALESNMEEAQRLSSIVEALLFLANAENTRIELEREPVDVNREISVIREYFDATALEAGVELTAKCPQGVQARVDRTLFQRAISNLVSNAISHTPPGGRVRIEAKAIADGVAIEVSDTGEGISPEARAHVFDRFYRADQARSAKSGRLGLGLPITKSIVDLHGGVIALQSELGAGTSIMATFPAGVQRA